MGTPYMPWQQYVADVSGEVDAKTGIPIYRDIIIYIPRQQGKTTVVFIKKIYRAVGFGSPQNIRFTAQTKDDAREKWMEHLELLKVSPLKGRFTARLSNGSEQLRWFNGSVENLKSGTEKSGHGKTLDLGIVSEAFAQIDNRLPVAMRPAMLTRPSAQMLIESTAGTATSLMLNELVRVNRERLLEEPDAPSRVAYFEWSADESDEPGELATWLKCMPALGHTISVADVQHEWDTKLSLADFRRSFLNIADLGQARDDAVFEPDDWRDTGIARAFTLVGRRTFALDVTNDRSWASVSWAGHNAAGNEQHEVIQHERGTHWVVGYLVDKLRRNDQDTVAVIGNTQAALMQDDLERAGIKVLVLSRSDYAAACAKYYDGIVDKTSRHLTEGQSPLDIAAAGAAWSTGDTRVWSRKYSTTDISPLVSCTVAGYAHDILAAREVDLLSTIA